MKKFKKALALSLALAMGLSLVACGGETETTTAAPAEDTTAAPADDTTAAPAGDDTEAPADTAALPMPAEDGATINVYSWNTELGDRLNYFYDAYPQYKDMVNYVNLGLGGTSDDYKTAIESAIMNAGDNYPSIIAADNDVALYFLGSEAVVPVSSIGITADMYANAYKYTVDYATIGGELKGLTWQAAPGCFVYRNDIADEVLGGHDEATVQAAVKDWDTFFATAETMKGAGYKMVSGPDDIKYAMMDQRTAPWVTDDTLGIDSAVTTYLEYSKKLYDNEYTNQTAMWSDGWTANFSGDVFGYFGCTWFVYWCIPADSKFYGNCTMVQGPVSYHWGGTYLGVTADCPNKELAALVLYTLCCDTDVMYKLSEETLDFVNNKTAVANLIADGKGASDVLAGQNPLSIWATAAEGISLDKATEYDSTFNGFLDVASAAYNSGELASVDDAVQNIKDQVSNAYQFITVQ